MENLPWERSYLVKERLGLCSWWKMGGLSRSASAAVWGCHVEVENCVRWIRMFNEALGPWFAVTALAWGLMAAGTAMWLLGGSMLWLESPLRAWMAVEVAFVFINAFRYWLVSRHNTEIPPVDSSTEVFFRRFVDVVSEQDLPKQVCDWFFNCEIDQIWKENVKDVIAYAFCYRTRKQMREDGMEDKLQAWLELFEEKTGLILHPGRNPSLKFRSHIWDKMPAMHLPLAFYALQDCVGWLSTVILLGNGFVKHSHRGVTYFTYGLSTSYTNCKGKTQSQHTPIMFMHGIGIGTFAYIHWIFRLKKLGHPLVIPEFRNISMRLCFSAPTVDDTAHVIASILEHHRLSPAAVVSHSFGTFVASRLATLRPDRVSAVCLIDPVCMLMHNSTLLSRFIYRNYNLSSFKALCASMTLMFSSLEPSISAAVSRNFYWTRLNFWREDLLPRTLVVFSEKDDLLPVADAKQMLTKTSAVVLSHPEHTHGEFLACDKWQTTILDQLKKICS